MLSRLLINNSRLLKKSFQPYVSLKFFAGKNKNESSLSDKEVDKTKKTIPQSGLKSDSEKIKPSPQETKPTQEQKPSQSTEAKPAPKVSNENIKVIETVANHRVILY
jgi:hypothetical protein